MALSKQPVSQDGQSYSYAKHNPRSHLYNVTSRRNPTPTDQLHESKNGPSSVTLHSVLRLHTTNTVDALKNRCFHRFHFHFRNHPQLYHVMIGR
ncbi:hypothetical protein RvY_19344 [Ramazzottius varieornatus]|uniref:Uncharacterized protein n=1 Tax=Ramazzottius varieornatus TaxID=947166 RepID=A0A1D1WA44_RAMVA|nr:hypothetical protein RvY_19344 [Ramazzottius varieornatus]